MSRSSPPPARSVWADLRPAIPAVLCFIVTRWLILWHLTPIGSDIGHYFEFTVLSHDLGRTPYGEGLPIEFPPVAWWLMSVVRSLGGESIAQPIDMARVVDVRELYFHHFRLVMFAADIAAFVVLIAILRFRRPRALPLTLLAYTLATAILGHVLYDRLDTVLLLLLLVWVYGWLRSSVDRGATIWQVVAYAGLGLAVSYKLVPVVVVPFVILADFLRPDRVKRLGVAAAMLAVTIALPIAMQYAVSGPGVFGFMTYQGERGIQIESIFASVMAVVSLAGVPIATTISHGAVDLVGPLAGPLKTLSTIALAAMVGGLWIVMWRKGATNAGAAAFRFGCLVIAGAVALANVLSVQFLVWALPMVLLLVTDLVGANTRAHLVTAAAVVLIAVLTTWIFPYHFFYLGDSTPFGLVPMGEHRQPLPPSPIPFIVLGLRNFVYAALVAWSGWRLVRAT